MVENIIIVGANLAGGRAAEALRQSGFDGQIKLIGKEPWRPYERPPLSKEMLWDKSGVGDNLFLHDEDWYAKNRIDLRLGTSVESLDFAGGGLHLDTGEQLCADRILLATGGRARILPLEGADSANVHHLRTKDDAERLALVLKPGRNIVVIGMGVIGAEVAASAQKSGCNVTVIEPAKMPMVRAIGNRFGDWLGRFHQRQGVRTYFGRTPSKLELEGNLVRAVECEDGTRAECDAVVVGIGIVPATELAEAAGILTNNGIVVDKLCRSSQTNIFAAGDVTEQPGFFGGRLRLETFQNATDQAIAAAHSMIGQAHEYCKPGWFWSDQYDLNIQAVGRTDDSLRVILRGEMDANEFTAFFVDAGIVVGVLTVNQAAEMGAGKRMVERRIAADFDMLADPSVPLRELLKVKRDRA